MYLKRDGQMQMFSSKLQFIKKEFTVSFDNLTSLDTQYFFNTALENRLFYIRKGRKDPKLSEVLD
jgi:hypothetical protein